MNELEETYTATDSKLLKHPDRLAEIKLGVWKPITLELAPTNKCNLDCVFCSVKNRDKTQKLQYNELIPVLEDFKFLGLKSIELTGGGDPTLYPKINQLIEWISTNTTWSIGLITNGIALSNIRNKNLDKLEWLRVSLNSLDYVNSVQIPQIKGTLGFSYVWNDYTDPKTALATLAAYKEKYNADYVRIVPDCLSTTSQEFFKQKIAPKITQDGFFAQSKPYSIPEKCWWGYLKPFLNADGFIYRCSACALLERKFPIRFRMGHMSEIKDIWTNVAPFNTSGCEEGKCFFASQNQLIQTVLEESQHDSFI